MTNPGMLDRILRTGGVANLVEVLVDRLTPTDLQSLFLEVYRRRAERRSPASLLNQYERNRFVQPSRTSPRTFIEIDRLAFALASPAFEPIEISPVCPLGTSSVVAPVSPHLSVATIRTTEVVSDSTNVLALECALRRKPHHRSGSRDRVRLCASHRLLRAQDYRRPGLLAHFRAFALCTAGRDEGSSRFEISTVEEQVRVYLQVLSALRGIGYSIGDLRVAITDLTGDSHVKKLQTGIIETLSDRFPAVRVEFDPNRSTGRGYYQWLCYKIYAEDRAGVEHGVGDGGFTPWTQKLLDDQKERFLISAIGTERICTVFARSEASP